MIRRPPRSTQSRSSAASDVYKRQDIDTDAWPQPRLRWCGAWEHRYRALSARRNPLTTQPTHAVPFRDLGVDEVICTALEAAGIITTFPIQALTLPLAINGQDIIGQARTGTGKTLAFGVPILHRLATTLAADRAAKQPSALIVVPTRELAIQVAEDLKQAGARMGARVLTVYGGRAYEPQIEALTAGTDVVVGTPCLLYTSPSPRD